MKAGLVESGRRTWEARAHIGDLEAVTGRSRIAEAGALTDPDGLGAEWSESSAEVVEAERRGGHLRSIAIRGRWL